MSKSRHPHNDSFKEASESNASKESKDSSEVAMDAGRRGFLQAGISASIAGPLLTPAVHASTTSGVQTGQNVQRYATLGRTGLKVSDVSFGSSRLRRGEEHLVAHALDKGVNYFDAAEMYTGGDSETVLGNALKGKRDQVVITSKIISRPTTSAATMMKALDESLVRLQTDYIDIYMNHAVNDVDVMKNPEWHAFTEAAKKAGKIRFTGMSGHAGYLIECVDYALDEDMVDVLLLAYNFGQDESFYDTITRRFDRIATQPDLPRVLERAKHQGVGVTVMKTLMGARLNDMRPYETGGATFAQAAFRWVLSNPNVDALVISMTDIDLIDEYLGASGSQQLAAGDLELLHRYARTSGLTYCRNACSDCDGSCPYAVPIADVMRTRMYATDYNDVQFARDEYALLDVNASACLSCSAKPCQNACTHGIDIAGLCAPTHRMLA
ncbi:MAG: aldo/keto reductase [Pseudomonadaceae bacterium]|nr:aldo/keto reductase [Pseudomonadaceae bacterium]